MNLIPVIMCGGSGARLWPESHSARPKQFLRLAGPHSMFQDTVLRMKGVPGVARPLIVAGRHHQRLIETQLAELGVEADLLLEPEARDSAPAMAAACAFIAAQDPEAVAAVVAADHHIPDAPAFHAAVTTAAAGARRGFIVTLGVRPTAPSTAYGYISPGAPIDGMRVVEAFVEKPDLDTACRYITEGFLWNSGNFVVRAGDLLAELDRYAPEISGAARKAVSEASGAVLGPSFRDAPKISIDYAVMEKTGQAAVLPVDFGWSDLGAWAAVWEVAEKDEAGNAVRGEALLLDTQDCLVRVAPGLQVAVAGTSRLAVIAEPGRLLVCDLAASQKIKPAADRFGQPSVVRAAAFADAGEAAAWFHQWLFTSALPLWWTLGADHLRGGFFEGLSPEGAPLEGARRSRVQTRQAFVYATAGEMGWPGPWRAAAWHAMSFFLSQYRRPDGRYRALVGPEGQALDETAALYDQAFALLAMAALHRSDPGHRDLQGEALGVLQALEEQRHTAGGFRECEPHVFQANAQMHLLEAALAWMDAGGGEPWRRLASEIVELALTHFIDPDQGFLREFYNEGWRPASGEDGRIVEPGHQFEWAWLLLQWAERSGDLRCRPAAERLFQNGLFGFDSARGVVIDALDDELTPIRRSARLWPQTEFLKAAVALQADDQICAAADGLRLYLETPAQGAWRDKLDPAGRFVAEAAPASSFYHIILAVKSLSEYVQRRHGRGA